MPSLNALLCVTAHDLLPSGILIHRAPAAPQAAARLGVKRLRLKGDSQLIIRQLLGEYKVKVDRLWPLHKVTCLEEKAGPLRPLCISCPIQAALDAIGQFDECILSHVPREQNKRADKLANDAVDAALRESNPGRQSE